MKTIITLALSALLAACGGGGATITVTKDHTVTVTPICNPIRIQLFGDSTQWGIDGTDRVSRAALYPELALQKEMDQAFGYGKVIVSTRAVAATTTGQLLAGTDGQNKPWPQSVDADIVVMNHGTNDDLTNVPLETYRANLRMLTNAPAVVVFETHIPDFHRDNGYAGVMRQVATELRAPIIDTNAYTRTVPNWDTYTPDYVHPNSEGYGLITRNAKFPILAPIVAKLGCGK